MPKLASGEDGEWSYAVYSKIPNKIKRKKKKKCTPMISQRCFTSPGRMVHVAPETWQRTRILRISTKNTSKNNVSFAASSKSRMLEKTQMPFPCLQARKCFVVHNIEHTQRCLHMSEMK